MFCQLSAQLHRARTLVMTSRPPCDAPQERSTHTTFSFSFGPKMFFFYFVSFQQLFLCPGKAFDLSCNHHSLKKAALIVFCFFFSPYPFATSISSATFDLHRIHHCQVLKREEFRRQTESKTINKVLLLESPPYMPSFPGNAPKHTCKPGD